MKKSALLVLALFVATLVSGCAKKTASEQLRDDMNKSASQMKKDLNNL